jgi:hypothetical protein
MKTIITIIILFLIPFSVFASCKNAKKYENYNQCIISCSLNCEKKCKKKYKNVLKYKKEYNKCYPIGYEDSLQSFRYKKGIDIWQDMFNSKK